MRLSPTSAEQHETVSQTLLDLMNVLPLHNPSVQMFQSAEIANLIFDYTLADAVRSLFLAFDQL